MRPSGGGVKVELAGLEGFARSANAHLSAMRLREDGAPKFYTWATRPPKFQIWATRPIAALFGISLQGCTDQFFEVMIRCLYPSGKLNALVPKMILLISESTRRRVFSEFSVVKTDLYANWITALLNN